MSNQINKIRIPKHLNRNKTISLYQEEIKICHYSYYLDEFYSDYDIDADVPVFIQGIYSDDRNTNTDKIKMTHEFILKYLTDEEYASSIRGLCVVYLDFSFFAIMGEKEAGILNLSTYKKRGNIMVLLEIEDDPEKKYLMYSNQVTISDTSPEKTARIDFIIYIGDEKIIEKRLCDTGASYTTIPYPHLWDYEKLKYKEDQPGGRYDFDTSTLNSMIKSTKNLKLSVASAVDKTVYNYLTVTFKEEIDVSIGSLKPVKISKMIVPKVEIKDLYIIGIDVLFKHVIIVSPGKFNIEMKIMSCDGEYTKCEKDIISSSFSHFNNLFGIKLLEHIADDTFSEEAKLIVMEYYERVKLNLLNNDIFEFVLGLFELSFELTKYSPTMTSFLEKWDITDKKKLKIIINRINDGDLQFENDFLALIDNQTIDSLEENYYDKYSLIYEVEDNIKILNSVSFDKFENKILDFCEDYGSIFPFILDIFIKWVETDRLYFLRHKYTFFEEFKSSF